jgi:hypothetical protein
MTESVVESVVDGFASATGRAGTTELAVPVMEAGGLLASDSAASDFEPEYLRLPSWTCRPAGNMKRRSCQEPEDMATILQMAKVRVSCGELFSGHSK